LLDPLAAPLEAPLPARKINRNQDTGSVHRISLTRVCGLLRAVAEARSPFFFEAKTGEKRSKTAFSGQKRGKIDRFLTAYW
jgi:hypothetical protein